MVLGIQLKTRHISNIMQSYRILLWGVLLLQYPGIKEHIPKFGKIRVCFGRKLSNL